MTDASIDQQTQLGFWRARARETAQSWREMASRRTVGSDIAAGLTVACVALPLNLALAIASGVPAGVGVVTAVIAGTVAGLFGGSRLQVTGPAAAMVPLVYEIIQRHGLRGLIVAGFLCGLIQIALGLARVGRLVAAIPVSVVTGFMSGIGLLILGGQLPRLLGLPAEIKTVGAVVARPGVLAHANVAGVLVGLFVFAATVLLPRLHKRLPASLLALIVATLVVVVGGFAMPAVGAIPRGIPLPALPDFAGVNVTALLPEVFAMAVLASAESLLSAVVVDSMARTPRHASDQELVAQGLANVASSLFGGLPVTGVIVRSSVAVQSGGRTRLAPVTHALALLAMMLVAAPYVARVPIAGLAGILLAVGLRLFDWRELRKMWRVSRFEAGVFVATMLGIVFTDFIDGVMIGLALALVHFAHTQRRLGVNLTGVAPGDEPGELGRLLGVADGAAPPPRELAVVRVEGPIFFASHQQLEAVGTRADLPAFLVFDLAGVPSIDVTGVETFKTLLGTLRARGTQALLARPTDEVRARLERSSLIAEAVGGAVFPTVADALAAVRANAPEQRDDDDGDVRARMAPVLRPARVSTVPA